jgi:large subunit ribosomal protein L5
MAARLKEYYTEAVVPRLMEQFDYCSVLEVPTLEKIVVNMGVGEAKEEPELLDAAVKELAIITGQRPSIRRARKSVAAFKVRAGQPIGAAATLRGERMWDFFDRLVNIALPRVRDFRGVSPNSFDGRGNYSLGLREQLVFPEIDYDEIKKIQGMNITIVSTAETDEEARELLGLLGMPFAR